MSGLNLAATISLDGSQFERGMARVGSSAASGIKNLVMQSVGVYTLQAAFRKTIDTADELVNTSKRLGIGVEQLQILQQAAKDAGTDLGALASSFEKIDIARAKALGGGADAKKFLQSFAAVGVTREMLQSMTAAALFQGPMAQKVSTTSPETLSEPLRDILGKAFGPDIAVLQTNFAELGAKMKSMGAIMDSTTAVELKVFKDEMGLISQTLISDFAPVIIFVAKALWEVKAVAGALSTAFGNFVEELAFWTVRGTKPQWDSIQEGVNYFKGQQDVLKGFDTRAKEIEDALNHPKPPDFHTEEGKQVVARREKSVEGDSLTKVGNFLGTSRSAINGIQQQMARDVTRTAVATEKIASFVAGGGKFGGKGAGGDWGSGGFSGHGAGGSWGETFFPIN